MSSIPVLNTASSIRPKLNLRYNWYLCSTYSTSVLLLVWTLLNSFDCRLDYNSSPLNFSNSSDFNSQNGQSNSLMIPHHIPACAFSWGAKIVTHLASWIYVALSIASTLRKNHTESFTLLLINLGIDRRSYSIPFKEWAGCLGKAHVLHRRNYSSPWLFHTLHRTFRKDHRKFRTFHRSLWTGYRKLRINSDFTSFLFTICSVCRPIGF